MERDFYTVAQIAAKPDVDVKTACEAVDAGEIPSFRVLRCIRIPRPALDRLIAEGTPKKP